MKFLKLALHLKNLENTSSRIKITEILSEIFKTAQTDEIDKITYLLLGQLAAGYRQVIFNIAERMMIQAISKAYGKNPSEVKKIYKETGDLGKTTMTLAKTKKPKLKPQDLSVNQVYKRLHEIADDIGEGSQERKIDKTAQLLTSLDPLSSRFVARIPVGKLRLGFSDKTIIDALSWMIKGNKSARGDLEKAYFVLPDVGLLAKSVKKHGISKAVRNIKPQIGIPVLPMLAQRLKSPTEMIEKMETVSVEPKYDGLRIQIHFKSGNGFVKAYTRNLNETSWMFPELKTAQNYIKAKEAILDCEAMGVDEERRALVNFQKTMTRRRKHKIEEIAKKVSIKFYVFDILLKNGKNLLNKKYSERKEILEKTLETSINQKKLFEIVNYTITKDPKVIEKMMNTEVKKGLEGIIVKRADSHYVPGRTGWRWVKMKEDEKSHAKLADTIDCVVMGYSVGKGKRAEFGIGQFLVGVVDQQKVKSLTKIGTGITDDQFRQLKKRLAKLEVAQKPENYEVDKNLKPDYWVQPSLVVEIAADEITKSPKHTSKFALRFPRLIKFRDKPPDQATTASEVKKLYKLQKS